MIHAITTGYVRITNKWVIGEGQGLRRLINSVMDKNYTDWLPIWCFVIEHPVGLIVIDTGIPENANQPVYFPPYIPLLQRAAKFKMTQEQEIGYQMRERGLNPEDVRFVILTHLHQDHDGGLHHFPNAEFIVSRKEWNLASGLTGRLGGYLNQRWADFFQPTLIDFTDSSYGGFPESYQMCDDLILVPTPGHSEGQMGVIFNTGGVQYMFIGDAAYTEDALLNTVLDGVTENLDHARTTMQRLRDTMNTQSSVILPSHDPESQERLQAISSQEALFLT